MDGADFELAKTIRFGESELVTENFDNEPFLVESSNPNRRRIAFGNSGLQITYDKRGNAYECHLDFQPEDRYSNKNNNPTKYVSMLANSIGKLHEFLNDNDLLKKFDIDTGLPANVSGISNRAMTDATIKMFSEHGHPEIVTMDKTSNTIRFDSDKFRLLQSDDPFILYLKHLGGRAEGQTVSYYKKV